MSCRLASHAMKKERPNEDEGDIQIIIPYAFYRRIHRLGKVIGKTPEELVKEAVKRFLKD